jgi:uncharacterized protein
MTIDPEALSGRVAAELALRPAQVAAAARLLAGGATIPFIARYRKEATGSLDEVALASIRDHLERIEELETRRAAILRSLEERRLLTDEVRRSVEGAGTLAVLEDAYAPFRPKRRTRATVARERGLEPLANLLLARPDADAGAEAARFINGGKDVPDAATALAGAKDIIAEQASDHPATRSAVRAVYESSAVVGTKVAPGKKDDPEAAKYRDYFQWSEPLERVPSHRWLAMRRGENEGYLILRVGVPEEAALRAARSGFLSGPAHPLVQEALEDGCRRLLFPSMETEIRAVARRKADDEAVRVFADNLRELLLASPLGQKRVLALDPGFRTGCKLVCLDEQGTLLHHDVVHLVGSAAQVNRAGSTIRDLVRAHRIAAIAIGNGTASRETEKFVRGLNLPASVPVVLVNESGASIYSASEAARREFPDHDLTVRGAVSIGRRLMDPLAELVKLDPKTIGVGQYQHDVDQNRLKQALDDCVASCVNAVGVEVNTASPELLSHVSGLNRSLAEAVVAYRQEHGPFRSREDLRQVPRFGPKAFEQAAGFLRIREASNPLDASAVHPERYALVERMAADLGCTVSDLLRREELRRQIDLQAYVSEEVGLPTLQDILAELAKPGRDPRRRFEIFEFAPGIGKPEDLQPGMRVPGIVTNVTKFGAFVDIGVHQDGLVHVSQLSDEFVSDPSAVVKVNQKVTATVLEVDLARKRISLSLKSAPDLAPASAKGGEDPNPRKPRPARDSGRPPGKGGKSGPAADAANPRNLSADEIRRRRSFPEPDDWFTAALKKSGGSLDGE